jgi:transposase
MPFLLKEAIHMSRQAYLIPLRVDELIPENHLARLVSEVIDEMGIEGLLRNYRRGGGASRYHPQMMTKLFVYGYMTKVCSSRMLAKAVRENMMFRTKVRCGLLEGRNQISGRSMTFAGRC